MPGVGKSSCPQVQNDFQAIKNQQELIFAENCQIVCFEHRHCFKVNGHTAMFSAILQRRNTLILPVCFLGHQNLSKIGSTPKGKNLLLEEQILSFKSRPLLKRVAKNDKFASPESVLIHLKVYRCISDREFSYLFQT